MIGDLLKQLPIALVRYVRYHGARVFGSRSTGDPGDQVFDAHAGLPKAGLDESYLEATAWPTYRGNSAPQDLRSDPLYELWSKTLGGQKWSHYFSIYRELFGHLTGSPQRVLEIGVYRGASLELWRQYFSHPETVIVGIDIEPSCAQFDSPKDGKRVRVGSQSDQAFLRAVVEEFGPFDLIIDDGSHRSADVIASFNGLFSSGLKDSGIYFVEDLHAAYWPDWRDSQDSFLDLCKELVEHMHALYQRASPVDIFVASPPDHPLAAFEVPRVATMIREIRFFDSIVAIYKTRRENAPFTIRMDYPRSADWVMGRTT